MRKSSTSHISVFREPRVVKNGSVGGSEWTFEGELSADALGETASDRYIARV